MFGEQTDLSQWLHTLGSSRSRDEVMQGKKQKATANRIVLLHRRDAAILSELHLERYRRVPIHFLLFTKFHFKTFRAIFIKGIFSFNIMLRANIITPMLPLIHKR